MLATQAVIKGEHVIILNSRQHKLCIVSVFITCLFFSATANSNSTALQESTKLYAAANSHGDLFGFSVAAYGNRIVVGALKQDHTINGADTGAAWFYRYEGGQWLQDVALLPKGLQPNDGFGGNVAMHNNIAAVGAIGHDGIAEDAGIVYVYQNFNTHWREVARVFAPDPQQGDSFGQSIALSRDVMVVGAPKEDDKGEDAGSVYVFSRKGTAWEFEQKLVAPDGASGDVFGISVAVSGDTILVGADLNDEKANNAGAAYVFVKQGNKWILQSKLMADDGGDTDIFGVRVALDGDTALISARRDDDEKAGKDAGSAYIFERKANIWYQQAKLTGPTQQADDRFGRSVALSGDTALIGAMHKDYAGQNAGAAYIFKRVVQKGSTQWRHAQTLTAAEGKAGDQLGWSVALASGFAVLGAVKHAPAQERSGAVYVFHVGEK